MNEEIYEDTPAKEDILIGTDSGYNRYKRPDGSTYVHYPYSRMATVTAYSAKDKNGQPIRTANGKLITGKTQEEANKNRFRYDMSNWIESNKRKTAHLSQGWRARLVTPDMDTFNAITGGAFNAFNPVHWGRGIYNISQGKDPGLILGNNLFLPDEYVAENPITSSIINGITGLVFNPTEWMLGGTDLYDGAKILTKATTNSAKPYINLITTGDKYTTLGGRFGYYGNKLDRFRYTLDRISTKSKLKPKHPELLRKSTNFKINADGSVQVSNPVPRADLNRTNFTTDRPVVDHSSEWNYMDLYIIDPKVVKGLKPISIEPSDMFYTNVNITAKPNQVTLVSGNPIKLLEAQQNGLSTLSSKKLRAIQKEMSDFYKKEISSIEQLSPLEKKLYKTDYKSVLGRRKDLKEAYALEIQRLQSLRGTPTLEDYRYIENLYNLKAGVTDIKEMNPKIIADRLKDDGRFIIEGIPKVQYPNGREIGARYFYKGPSSEKAILESTPYNRVFYDPASHVEFNFRTN